jgi:hypothetical protein
MNLSYYAKAQVTVQRQSSHVDLHCSTRMELKRNHNFRFKARTNQHVNGGGFVPARKPLLHLCRSAFTLHPHCVCSFRPSIDCQKNLGCNALVVPSRRRLPSIHDSTRTANLPVEYMLANTCSSYHNFLWYVINL